MVKTKLKFIDAAELENFKDETINNKLLLNLVWQTKRLADAQINLAKKIDKISLDAAGRIHISQLIG